MPARPPSRRNALGLVAAMGALPASGVFAQPSNHGLPQPAPADAPVSQEERWRRRYPQPVLVSDLSGRLVLDRDQGVLGWIESLVRGPDCAILIAFARRRLFLVRGPTVVVPANVTALLGRFVMILDLADDEIARLPALVVGAAPVDPASRIAMALTKH